MNICVCTCSLLYYYKIKCITQKLQYQYLAVLTGKASPSMYSMVMATSRSQTLTVSHWGRVWVTRVWMVTTISSVSCQNHTDLQNSMSKLKLHWWFLVKHQYQMWISKHGLYSRQNNWFKQIFYLLLAFPWTRKIKDDLLKLALRYFTDFTIIIMSTYSISLNSMKWFQYIYTCTYQSR